MNIILNNKKELLPYGEAIDRVRLGIELWQEHFSKRKFDIDKIELFGKCSENPNIFSRIDQIDGRNTIRLYLLNIMNLTHKANILREIFVVFLLLHEEAHLINEPKYQGEIVDNKEIYCDYYALNRIVDRGDELEDDGALSYDDSISFDAYLDTIEFLYSMILRRIDTIAEGRDDLKGMLISAVGYIF